FAGYNCNESCRLLRVKKPRRRQASRGRWLIANEADKDGDIAEARVSLAGNGDLIIAALHHGTIVDGHILVTIGPEQVRQHPSKSALLSSPFTFRLCQEHRRRQRFGSVHGLVFRSLCSFG